ncbi:6-pyruvoyltetrahydropterin/6-carboxytetrahydropterin synthase [Parelusimicrobium proximum]|uniref:6-pyruvoyl trahydropterin synthase family protein n=1 Tax=Parelusimicrobium proximum TaxID=3228953 RepID=UPI003D16A08D
MSESKKISIVRKSFFVASHRHKGSLDETLHNHEFRYEVRLHGYMNDEGYLLDFRAVNHTLKENINKPLNYKELNNILGGEATTEQLAVWIYEKLKPTFKEVLKSVTVYETDDNYVIYEGE